MMCYKFKLTVLFFLPFMGWGQYTDSGNHGLMLITTREAPEKAPTGSPYFEDDEFRKGIVYISEKTSLDAWLRYNVMEEVMEIKLNPDSEEVYRLPLEEEVVYKFGSRTYSADRLRVAGSTYFGYFTEYYRGQFLSLLGKPQLEIQESTQPKSGYTDSSDRLKIKEEYFVIWNTGKIEKVRPRHREVRNLFDSKLAQDYLKNNRVRSIEDLTDFIAFYDKSMPQEN